jgi:hypothetical protein
MAGIDERARLKMMPVRELLAEAKARGIPTKGLLEKSEFIEALVAASAPAPATASSSSSSSGCSAAELETPRPTSGTSAHSAFVMTFGNIIYIDLSLIMIFLIIYN